MEGALIWLVIGFFSGFSSGLAIAGIITVLDDNKQPRK